MKMCVFCTFCVWPRFGDHHEDHHHKVRRVVLYLIAGGIIKKQNQSSGIEILFHGAYMDEFHIKSFLVNAILFCLLIILDLRAAYSLSASTHCSGVHSI